MAHILVTLNVYLDVPVARGDDPADYITAKERTRLEKQVIKALSKLDGDADCEVMDATISHDDEPEVDEAYERAAARARNNDFADTGGKDWT